MAFCQTCGDSLAATAAFCGQCGHPVGVGKAGRSPAAAHEAVPAYITVAGTARPQKGGFIQTFGLDIRVAILAVLVDTLVFGGSLLTLGALYFFEFFSGVVMAFITYKIQKNWYGDSHDSALIKGAVIGLLTAIPAPIAWLFAVPGGALGILHLFRR